VETRKLIAKFCKSDLPFIHISGAGWEVDYTALQEAIKTGEVEVARTKKLNWKFLSPQWIAMGQSKLVLVDNVLKKFTLTTRPEDTRQVLSCENLWVMGLTGLDVEEAKSAGQVAFLFGMLIGVTSAALLVTIFLH
jgi:hypothetical protein